MTVPGAGGWRRVLPAVLAAAAVVLLMFFTADDITRSGNETSRLALVESLGDRADFSIDGARFQTVDKGRIGTRFYSDKPMLYSLGLTGIYLVAGFFGGSFAGAYHDTLYLLNFLGAAFWALLIMAALYFRLRRFGPAGAAIMSFLGVFSTWLFSYAGVINNHLPAAFFLLLFFLLLERGMAPGRRRGPVLAAAGLAAGVLINLEIPTGFFFALAGGLALLGRGRWPERIGGAALLGGFFLLPVAAVAGVNWFAYGSPLPVYLVRGAYDFPGNVHSSGMAGLEQAESAWRYFFHLLIGDRGFFSYMPALLLAIPALAARRRKWSRPTWFFVAATAVAVVFYGFWTGDYGGWAYGFRFLIPLIPLLWLWLSEWLLDSAGKGWRLIFAVLALWGVITSLAGAYNPWPVCSRDNARLRNTLKINLYCSAYEYGPGVWWAAPARAWMGTGELRKFLPLYFYNLRKIGDKQLEVWPVTVPPRETVAARLRRFLCPTAGGLVSLALGAVVLAALAGAALRLLGWWFGRRQLWLGWGRLLLYAAPLLCWQTILLVVGCALTVGLNAPALAGAALLWRLLLGRLLPSCRVVIRPWRGGRGRWLLLLPGLMVLLLLATALTLPPLSWDVLTYHLFIPLRWIQDGGLVTVPTVFGDNAAAYAPKNWFALAAAALLLLPGDAVIEVLTLPLLFFAAAATAALVREAAGDRKAAVLTGLTVFFTPVLLNYALMAQPDVITAGLLAAALYWLVRERKDGEKPLTAEAMAALCCGLAAGMKTASLPFVALPLVVLGAGMLRRRDGRALAVSAAVFLASGGGWFLYNWIVCGNPLFPLDVGIGGWRFWPGAYDAAAVRRGEFHAVSTAHLVATVWRVFGPWLTVLLPLGAAGWGVAAWLDRVRRRRLVLLGVHAWGWLLIYALVIPHHLQTRFLFPALLLALGGLAVMLVRLRLRPLLVLVLTGFCLGAMEFCRARAMLLSDGLLRMPVAEAAFLLGMVLVLLSWGRFRRGWRRAVAWAIGLWLLAAVLTRSADDGDVNRALFYRRLTGFDGVAAFNLPGDGSGAVIAYSGFNRPYVLAGAGRRNRVVYVNVQGRAVDDFYRFWGADPKIWSYHKPGLYRNHPDWADWLRNLRENRVDYLVLMPLGAAERRYLPADAAGLPLPEAAWAAAHPEWFRLEMRSPAGAVYRFNAAGAAPSP